MANATDIEYEMSRFEEEITKLTPAGGFKPAAAGPALVDQGSSALVASAPSFKPKISIQMPTTLPNAAPSAYPYGAMPLNPYMPQPYHHHVPGQFAGAGGQKRDAAGNLVGGSKAKAPKVVATTAAAAATAVAAAAFESDTKAKKAKEEAKAKEKKKTKKFIRAAGGQTWEDDTLVDWDPDDFRIFCGDLGNEVNDELLCRAFQKYPSFQKGKVVRDRRTGKTKGFGFVSFKSSDDFIKAMREMDGKYVGNRPIKLRKSNWKDRNLDAVKKKEQERQKMGLSV